MVEKTTGMLKYWRLFQSSPRSSQHLEHALARASGITAFYEQPLVIGAVKTLVTNVIHSGMTLQLRPDSKLLGIPESELSEWAEDVEAKFRNWAKVQRFGEKQRLLFQSALIAGDCLAFFGLKNGQLDVRLVDSFLLDQTSNGNEWVGGVRTSRSSGGQWGEIDAIRIQGEADLTTREIMRVGPGGRINFVLYRIVERVGQVRGLPIFAPIIAMLKNADRFIDAEVTAAVLNSAMVGAVYSDKVKDASEMFRNLADPPEDVEEGVAVAQSGTLTRLSPGEKVEFYDSKRPSASMDVFINTMATLVGGTVGLPSSFILKRFDASYSASRGEIIEALKTIDAHRAHFASHFLDLVFRQWMRREILRGEIEAPGFLDNQTLRYAWSNAKWQGLRQNHINPLQEVQSSAVQVAEGFRTRSEVAEEYGGDFVSDMQKYKRDEQLFREAKENESI